MFSMQVIEHTVLDCSKTLAAKTAKSCCIGTFVSPSSVKTIFNRKEALKLKDAAPSEDQLSKINEQLSQLQASIDSLTKQKAEISSPISNRDFGPRKPKLPTTATPNSASNKSALSPDEQPYLGESSFELHSHQTGQILDIALHNSPAAGQGQDVTSSLQSLRGLHSGSIQNSDVDFTSDLPMPPVQTALAALRLLDGA